ncbi:MAG: manganese efflux pump [Firmicutes bacterium]|nr:manganese efflux pump [Bacillota bacterium]MCL2771439.1 manganese efflux pump [Bacillota bacterium]
MSIFLSALFLTFSISLDALAMGFAYGANRIRIPFVSILLITIVGSIVLGLSLFFGSVFSEYIDETATIIFSSSILITLGVFKILGSIFQRVVTENSHWFIKLFAKPEEADKDKNKILSTKEALALALALSLDCIAVGVGAGIIFSRATDYIIIIAFSLVLDVLFIFAGLYAGTRLAKKSKLNLAWLSGLVLISIGILKIWF